MTVITGKENGPVAMTEPFLFSGLLGLVMAIAIYVASRPVANTRLVCAADAEPARAIQQIYNICDHDFHSGLRAQACLRTAAFPEGLTNLR